MADETRIEELLDELNHQLGDYTPYKLAFVNPADILPVEKNAHYMPKRIYDQLVANVSADKNLSSLPFCWLRPDGKFVALSGNHRVMAAAGAKVAKILVLYTDGQLSKAEQISIQLSHNSLVGQDNPSLLLELWNEIDDLRLKIYTGLDDNQLKTLAPISITRLNEEPLRLEELTILFIPSELARIEELVKLLGPVSRKRFAAMAQEYDPFFEVLLNFKEATGIINTATAFMQIAEIVTEWLENHKKTEHNETEQ